MAEAKAILARGGKPKEEDNGSGSGDGDDGDSSSGTNSNNRNSNNKIKSLDSVTWPCKICGKVNVLQANSCVACGLRKPVKIQREHENLVKERDRALREAKEKEEREAAKASGKVTETTWACKVCKKVNDNKHKKCTDCGRWRPRSRLKGKDGADDKNKSKLATAQMGGDEVETLVLKLQWGGLPPYAKVS